MWKPSTKHTFNQHQCVLTLKCRIPGDTCTVKEANFEQQGNFERFRKVLFTCLAGQIRLKLAHQLFYSLSSRVALSISTVCFSLQC